MFGLVQHGTYCETCSSGLELQGVRRGISTSLVKFRGIAAVVRGCGGGGWSKRRKEVHLDGGLPPTRKMQAVSRGASKNFWGGSSHFLLL